jgi:hypothetical protein
VQSVKSEGGLLRAADEQFGAQWKHAAGAPKKREAKGRDLIGAAVPSVRLRLDGDFRTSMLATWMLGGSDPGVDMLVCAHANPP